MDDIRIPKVGEVLTGTVVKVTQEEVLVDVGYMFEGTIYKDHLSTEKVNDARDFVKLGDTIDAKVTKLSHGDETNILLMSRIDLERAKIKEQHANELEDGSVVKAKVKRANQGGLELDYHGLALFMPNSMVDLKETGEEFKKSLVGQEVEVKIMERRTNNRGKDTFLCNRKQVQYDNIKKTEKEELDKFQVGDKVEGKVLRLLDFGAIIQLSDHIEGLLHVSEASHRRIKHVNEVLTEGQTITVEVIRRSGKKVSLSLKSLLEKPWDLFVKNHKVGDKVEGVIAHKTNYGMFIELPEGVRGLLARNDFSWDPQDNLAGRVQVGDTIEVEIIAINPDKQQFALSKKHLEYNPWGDIKFRLGDVVSATVKSFQEKGAIVDVEGVDAFLPVSEVSEEHIGKAEDVLKVGDVLSVEVTTFFPKEWKLVVSRRKVTEKANRAEYAEHLKDNVSGNQSLKDLFEKFKK